LPPPTNSGIPARGLPLRKGDSGGGGGGGNGRRSFLGTGGGSGGSFVGDGVPVKKMKSDGCGPRLREWIIREKLTWATTLASIFALEVMAVGIAAYLLSRVKKMRKLR